jgi:type IV secretory pathway protease TraF
MEKQSASKNSGNKIFCWKLTTREKSIALAFLAALLAGLWLPTRIIVSTSKSLDHRLFFMTKGDINTIKNGDYLVFRHHDTPFVHQGIVKDTLYIKKVGCKPGQTLRRDDNNQFFCEQRLIGKALARDSKGRDLPQFTFDGRVPANSFFMVGTHPRSFDSKYFGFIHADEIRHKALPLW